MTKADGLALGRSLGTTSGHAARLGRGMTLLLPCTISPALTQQTPCKGLCKATGNRDHNAPTNGRKHLNGKEK